MGSCHDNAIIERPSKEFIRREKHADGRKFPVGAMLGYLADRGLVEMRRLKARSKAPESQQRSLLGARVPSPSIFMISHKTSLKLRSIKRNPRSSLLKAERKIEVQDTGSAYAEASCGLRSASQRRPGTIDLCC